MPTNLPANLPPAGVRQVLRVLGGEDESALVAATSHWLQLLVAELLHLRPNVTARQHLRALMEHCVSISAGPGGAAGQQEGAVPVLSLMSDLLEVRGRSQAASGVLWG